MERADDVSYIQGQDEQESSSDSVNGTQQNGTDVAPSEKTDTESIENEKEEDEGCVFLKVGDSPKKSLANSPAGKDTNDQDSRDSQDTTEYNHDGENGEHAMEHDSISLSTLISTIIKGTVASMDDVGREKKSSTVAPPPISPGEIVSSSQLQDEALSSATDNQTSVTDPGQDTVRQANTYDFEETSLPPIVLSTGRGRGRRGPRMQRRFSLSKVRPYEDEMEVPKTETINTEGGKIFQCVSCKVSFNYEQDMQMHLQTHLRPRYHCPVCSRRFLNQSTLERHLVTHEHTKPYVCSICSQGFRIKSNLNRHYQRIHNSKVGVGEPRRGRPVGSMPRPNMPTQENTLASPKYPIQNLGMVPVSIPHSYPSPSTYRDSQTVVSNFAAPQINFQPTLHYEQAANASEPDNDIVSSTERIPDFPQPPQTFDFDQSPYITTVTSDKADPEQNQPNTSQPHSRMAPTNLGEDDDSHAQLFLSRYPDVESAVVAIRKIETERLFHQELLLEELKLRRKYGLPSGNVIDDMKKEIALKEKIGDLDSLMAQGGGDFGGLQALRNAKPVADPDTMTEATHSISPSSYIVDTSSFQIDRPAMSVYLPGELAGRRGNEGIKPTTIPSDLHHGAQDIMTDSQASTQLRRLSAFSTAIHSPYQLAASTGGPSNFNSASDVEFASPQISVESSNDWSAAQHLRALTPPFGRPKRGRRRLASMPPRNMASLPPQYAGESEIQQQSVSFQPRKLVSPATFSQNMLVHHRPALSNGPALSFPPPALVRPPPLPFRIQHDQSHRFSSVANLPPPPEYVLPTSPRCPVPKRFRPPLQHLTSAQLQTLEDLTYQKERDLLDAMRSTLDAHPSQPKQVPPVSSANGPGVNISNPFSMSGPPNRSLEPIESQSSLQSPNSQSAFSVVTPNTPSRPTSNHTSNELDDTPASPLDLSRKT